MYRRLPRLGHSLAQFFTDSTLLGAYLKGCFVKKKRPKTTTRELLPAWG